MTKYRYISKVTGEVHENLWEVAKAVGWWIIHCHRLDITLDTSIKYIFLWSYSRQGF